MREELQPWMDILYRAPAKAMSLNARGERWRGTICNYDCGDDHPNNVIDHANVFAASAVRSVDLRVGSPVDCYQHSRAEVVAEPASNAIAQALVLSSLFHNLIGRDLRRVKMLDERSMV